MTATRTHRQASGMEHLLLGDWGRWIRDPIDVLRLIYIGGGIVVVISGSFGRVPSLVFGAAVALTARAISLPRPFDLAIVAGMVLPTAGNALGLFHRYDALYEIYEYLANTVLGATLSTGYADTIKDLALDFAGSAAGGALLVLWSVCGWATMRRLPGEAAVRRIEGAESGT